MCRWKAALGSVFHTQSIFGSPTGIHAAFRHVFLGLIHVQFVSVYMFVYMCVSVRVLQMHVLD